MVRKPRRRRRGNGPQHIRAVVGDVIITGTSPQQIEKKLEVLGYDAERERDMAKAHTYFQAADHYKREGAGYDAN